MSATGVRCVGAEGGLVSGWGGLDELNIGGGAWPRARTAARPDRFRGTRAPLGLPHRPYFARACGRLRRPPYACGCTISVLEETLNRGRPSHAPNLRDLS